MKFKEKLKDMIKIINFSPAIDRIYHIDDFKSGTKFLEIPPEIYLGGKGINVAKVCSLLGEPPRLFSYVGSAEKEFMQEELASYDISLSLTEVEGLTRNSINIIDNKNEKETEITEPGFFVSNSDKNIFFKRFLPTINADDIVICSGILARGMSKKTYRVISTEIEKRNAKCVLDVPAKYFLSSFPGKYFFIKPNLSEFNEITEKLGMKSEGMYKCAKKILALGVENMLVSTGSEGGYFFSEELVLKISIPETKAVSTIGSGDATVAGFCTGLSRKYNIRKCILLGIACGISNSMNSEPGKICADTITEIMEKIIIKEIRGETLSDILD